MAVEKIDHMEYREGMEIIDSDVMDRVLDYFYRYDYKKYTAYDVLRALQKDYPGIEDLQLCCLLLQNRIWNKWP